MSQVRSSCRSPDSRVSRYAILMAALLGGSKLAGCGKGESGYGSLSDGGTGSGGNESGGEGQGGQASATYPAVFPALHVEGNRIRNEAGDVVVLRGVSTIDLGTTDQSEGGLLKMIDRLTDRSDSQGDSPGWYPTVIRLAIYPADSTNAQSPITFQSGSDAFYENVLRKAVDHTKARGAYAIIDWHYIGDTDLYRAQTEEFWSYMAPKFADEPNVIFELFNEPVNRESGWPVVKADMQTWYDIVRQSAKENLVLVGTPSWCQQLAPVIDAPLDGYNVAYVAHLYPMHWQWPNLRNDAERANAVYPVFLSEWGFDVGSDSVTHGDQATYGAPYKEWAESQQMSTVAWCASHTWTPPMFDKEFKLLVGPERMGGFAKDWMYELRNVHAPFALD